MIYIFFPLVFSAALGNPALNEASARFLCGSALLRSSSFFGLGESPSFALSPRDGKAFGEPTPRVRFKTFSVPSFVKMYSVEHILLSWIVLSGDPAITVQFETGQSCNFVTPQVYKIFPR